MQHYTILKLEYFDKAFKKLKDREALVEIKRRLVKIQNDGYLGGNEPITNGFGLRELRFFVGKGYRIYYVNEENTNNLIFIYLGTKDTQKRDIKKAIDILKEEFE